MNLATVLLTAILEVAAAFAGWAGGFTYAVCRPALQAPAWRHVVAASASVGLAAFTYFSALVTLGQGATLSGREDNVPATAGPLVLAIVFGLGAGVPWGLFRHAGARSLPRADTGDDDELWPVARRTSARLFLPFATLGLVIFAPRADGEAASAAGGVLAGALLVVVLAAVGAIALRHRRPVLKLAGWGALAGVPLLTALLAVSGVSLGEAFVFSAASALVWAPVFGLVTWAVVGTHEAGFRITRTGLVTRSAAASDVPVGGVEGKRLRRQTRRRTRRR